MKNFVSVLLLFSLFTSVAFAVGSGSGGTLPDDGGSVVVEEDGGSAEEEATVVEAVPVEEEAEETVAPVNDEEKEEVEEGNVTPAAVEESVEVEAAPEAAPVSEEEAEEEVVCHFIEDLEERVQCRFEKDHEALKAELKEYYLPEECRAMEDKADQNSCTKRYKDLWPCWKEAAGSKRLACVKKKLALPQKLAHIDKYCAGESDACRESYKQKVYHLITFRFYDAEERVEHWFEEGRLDLDDTVDFVVFIAESKIAFNEASKKSKRVGIIEDVMEEWEDILDELEEVEKEV